MAQLRHPEGAMPQDWTAALTNLDRDSRHSLAALPRTALARGAVLFRAGELASGFPVVVAGRVEVVLTGASGRELLLYAVEPGQSCVQTTLGLLGNELYSAEAVAVAETDLVMIPRATFLALMDSDPAFRREVIRLFARRMQEITRLLERVAFGRIEARLADALLLGAQGGVVQATHAELAARIGSAREVVTRRIDAFVREGWVSTDRGEVRILDEAALRQLAASLG
jgi:CRP/FNR family transcriptional regulator